MFWGVCAIVLFAACWLPFRLVKLLRITRKIVPWSITAGIVIILIASFYGMMAASHLEKAMPSGWFINIGSLFFIFLSYWFLLALLEFGLHRWLKKWMSHTLCAVLPISIAAMIVAYGWIHAQSFRVTNYEITLTGLTKPVTVMHISDLHLGLQRGERYLDKVVETINQHNPDMVIYNGDLVDSNCALRPELFERFKQVKCRQIFTIGNHEYYIDTKRVLDLLAQNGVEILRNRAIEVNGLELIGLEYMNADRKTIDAHRVNDLTVEEELPKINRKKNQPAVLVHHSPRGAEYVSRENIPLMLAGHTHNGQVFPGNLLVRFMFPYCTGLYRIENTTLLVSPGAGTFGPWMRLGSSNELQLIKLIPTK